MKVRIEDQRIVYRINDEDKHALLSSGRLVRSCRYGSEQIHFELIIGLSEMVLDLEWSNSLFSVRIPKLFIEDWPDKQVGYSRQFTKEGDQLIVSVEKDLKRSKRRAD